MLFDLDSCLDDLNIPAGKERAGTYTTPYSPSRMGLTIIPSFDSTEVSSCKSIGQIDTIPRLLFSIDGLRSELVPIFDK